MLTLAALVGLLLLVVALTGVPYLAFGALVLALGVFAVGGPASGVVLGSAIGSLVALILLLPIAFSLASILLLRFRQRFADAWDAVPFDMHNHVWPASLREFGRQNVSRLGGIGFHVVADLFNSENAKVRSRVIVLENADGTETATVVAHSASTWVGERSITFLEYATRSQDGRAVRTTTNVTAGLWAQLPEIEEFCFPEEHDPARIVRIGRAIRDRRLPGPYKPADHQGEVVPYIREHLNRLYDHGVERGRLVRDVAGSCYRPSWLGALLLTVGTIPPASWMWSGIVARGARRRLSELGVEPPPPPAPTAAPGNKHPGGDSALGPAVLATAFVLALLWWFSGGLGRFNASAGVRRYEARAWLTENPNPSALASNRFIETDSAIAFVDRLYEAGAREVLVWNVISDEAALTHEVGSYTDMLVVVLPDDEDERAAIFQITNAEQRRGGFDPDPDRGQPEVYLWWK